MTYLDQPVFLFPVHWASSVQRQVTFDLRPEDVGFGAEYFTPLASWTVNGWQFECDLDSAGIAAFDAFTAALVGRANGFWLPVPVEAAQITSGSSTTVFSVVAESLSTFWNDRPDTYLLFTFPDGTQTAAKITSVVAAGATETVTVDNVLPQIPSAETTICRLHFVRLAEDVEEGEFYQECRMMRKVSVAELPMEYAGAILGAQPIYLFHFWANAPAQNDWRFTSFASPVVSKNQAYQNYPINFSGLTHVLDMSTDDLKIEAKPDPAHPFSLFLPVPFSGTLFVEIFALDLSSGEGALDNQTKLFSGRVVSVEDTGTKLTANCESRLGYLKRKLPRYLKGTTCQNTLYNPNTCKAGRAYFETSVSLDSVSDTYPPTVLVTPLLPAFSAPFFTTNYLQNGQIETGVGVNYEARTIIASQQIGSQIQLTLNLPFARTNAGVNAQIVAGCNHSATMCQQKFNNYKNFNGFVAIPDRNPTLKAVNANPVSQGGK